MVRLFLLISFALLQGLTSQAQAAPPSLVVKPAAEIWYSEQFIAHSAIVGRDFLIQVAKPPLQDGAEKAPAIYILDGNSSFGLAANIMQGSVAGAIMAPAYVIGVGYPSQTRKDWQALRSRDLTFVPVAPTEPADHELTGEAMKFQRFLTEELRPLIEARYPIDRALLAGHSYGGLFAAHVLLNDPRAFDGYLIGSPSLWAEPALLEKAATFRAPNRVPVFIAVGAKEAQQNDAVYHMVRNMTALAARLADHPSNLDIKAWVVPEENHTTVRPAFLARAMPFVLPPPEAGKPAH